MADDDYKIVTRKPRKCPFCGSLNVKPCLWGMPAFDYFEKKGIDPWEEYIIEGCIIDTPARDWGCKNCNASFYKKRSYENDRKYFLEALE